MNRTFRTLTLSVAVILNFFCIAFSQVGPGGIGNSSNLSFWVKANTGTNTVVNNAQVNSWLDQSGNNNHLSQPTANKQPRYSNNFSNNYPGILFDNDNSVNNDLLFAADADNLDNTTQLTIIAVGKHNELNGEARTFVSKRNALNDNHSYMFFTFTGRFMYADIVGGDQRTNTDPAQIPALNTPYIHTVSYDGTNASQNQRVRIFRERQNITNPRNLTATNIPNFNSPLVIGATHLTDTRPFGGEMAEIIIFRKALNTPEKIIVDNYLSAKYNIPISSEDYYTMDNPAFGNFDHEVAGIGRNGSEIVTFAKGTAPLTVLNPSNLNNNDYLLWGHNNLPFVANVFNQLPAGVQARMAREWRANRLGTVGTVSMRFNLSNLGPVTASDLRLLFDPNGDGNYTDATSISGAVAEGSGNFRFDNITINDAARFTIGTINSFATPLPVRLTRFNIQILQNQMHRLVWETTEEVDNKGFEIQRADQEQIFKTIGFIHGNGTTNLSQSYQFIDSFPYRGINYYRLKQIDWNGDISYSHALLVASTIEKSIFRLSPNPVTSIATIRGHNIPLKGIRLFNITGRNIPLPAPISHSNQQISFDLGMLPKGQYIFLIANQSIAFIKQ